MHGHAWMHQHTRLEKTGVRTLVWTAEIIRGDICASDFDGGFGGKRDLGTCRQEKGARWGEKLVLD